MQIWYSTKQAVWLKRRFLFQLNSTVSSSTSWSTYSKNREKRQHSISLKLEWLDPIMMCDEFVPLIL